ncbi:glycosyltransferase family 9 protein [Paraburkholderia sediminicola]|uniref:glycosyltransferase family 9 protein n=1 Tax=Paraburkholderia sediminicola TaxID=458836 RepID=UPI0038BCBB51
MTALFPDTNPPRSILVICTGRIGDVLLSTPAVRSLKARWPDAQIDMLVFEGAGEVLENNPDIRRVICITPHAKLTERVADVRKIWRKYDLGCSLRTSSLASFLCWTAGRKRIGIVAPARRSWIKKLMLNRFVIERGHSVHTVESGVSLMAVLGITPRFEVVPPAVLNQPAQLEQLDSLLAPTNGKPYAVVHMYPRYTYKMWHIEGWIAVLAFLHARGYAVVLTGGPAAAEVTYARDICERTGIKAINLVGKLSLAATAEVIRRARLFIGPDTSASHIAAATGTPTLALFGPSNPVRWGPWPKGWTGSSPWLTSGSGQRGNVYLLQGTGACVPCKLEGCDAHVDSWSDCLLTLDANRVIDVATELLGIAPNIAPDRRRRIPIVAQPFAGARLEMADVGNLPGQANPDPSLEIPL